MKMPRVLDIVKPESVSQKQVHQCLQTAATPQIQQQERKAVKIVGSFMGSPDTGRTVTSDCNMGIVFKDSYLWPHCTSWSGCL